jgi:hypothetical protein
MKKKSEEKCLQKTAIVSKNVNSSITKAFSYGKKWLAVEACLTQCYTFSALPSTANEILKMSCSIMNRDPQ